MKHKDKYMYIETFELNINWVCLGWVYKQTQDINGAMAKKRARVKTNDKARLNSM